MWAMNSSDCTPDALGFVSSRACAALLGIGLAQLRTRVNRNLGCPPAYRTGQSCRFRLSEIEAWIEQQLVTPQAAAPAWEDPPDEDGLIAAWRDAYARTPKEWLVYRDLEIKCSPRALARSVKQGTWTGDHKLVIYQSTNAARYSLLTKRGDGWVFDGR